MHWILQSNLNKYYDQWVQELTKLNSKFTPIEILPFSDIQPEIKTDAPTLVYGTTSLMKFAQKQWTPGAFFTPELFRSSLWQQKFGEQFLNHDGKLCKLNDLKTDCPDTLFIRPDNDLKDFTGVVVKKESLMNQIDNINSGGFLFDGSIDVFIAPPKHIQKEFRFFIVDGKVVAGCQYKLKSLVMLNNKLDQGILDNAQALANIWTPAPVCVMDVALDNNDKYKLLEFNCFNASGLYICNLEKIIISVEKYVNSNY